MVEIQYSDSNQAQPVNSCQDALGRLKTSLRKHLNIDDERCLLVKGTCSGDVVETIIMIECCDTEKMKMYKVPKHPQDITQEDIKELMDNPCKFKASPICLKKTE
jgi:hypothetical protein